MNSESVSEPREEIAAIDRRLQEICSLLEDVSGGELRLIPDSEPSGAGESAVAQGWMLSGGNSERDRKLIAELIRNTLQAEEEIKSLSAEILERYEEASLVYSLSDKLGAVLGDSAISNLVLSEAARVLGARAGEFWLCGETNETSIAAVLNGRELPRKLRGHGMHTAIESGQPWIYEADEKYESMVAVPLRVPDGAPLGVLMFCGRRDDRSYRAGEVKLLSALASLASAFIRNDRLAEEARHTAARKREDEIARQIHAGLLPAEDPRVAGLEFSGSCIAAENIGGDYYGYFQLPDGAVGLSMADVSGHGVAAALQMAAAKGALQAEVRWSFSPGELLCRTNEALVEDFIKSDVFATALFVRFHADSRRLDYANGGHTPPLLIRADGRIERLEPGGPALGVVSGLTYENGTKDFGEGDCLVVYTDGITEARDAEGNFYGSERLCEIAVKYRMQAASTIRAKVLEDLHKHCGANPPADDVTLVVVRGEALSGSSVEAS